MLKVKEWIKSFLKARAERKKTTSLRRDQELFQKLLGDEKSNVPALVRAVGASIASKHIEKWLDAKRIARCSKCVRTDQLRRVGKEYRCPVHAHEAAK